MTAHEDSDGRPVAMSARVLAAMDAASEVPGSMLSFFDWHTPGAIEAFKTWCRSRDLRFTYHGDPETSTSCSTILLESGVSLTCHCRAK